MPKTPVDYSRTVIYKLQHIEDESLLYVGSTTDFTRRKSQHKYICNNPNCKEHNQKKYNMIRENGGWEMFKMIEIQEYPCRNSKEARRREDELMREMKANMNMVKAHCGHDTIHQYKQQYNKQYRDDNKETIQQYKQQYYNNNKEKINKKKAEKIHCECGCTSTRANLSTHRKTKKHINLINNTQ